MHLYQIEQLKMRTPLWGVAAKKLKPTHVTVTCLQTGEEFTIATDTLWWLTIASEHLKKGAVLVRFNRYWWLFPTQTKTYDV